MATNLTPEDHVYNNVKQQEYTRNPEMINIIKRIVSGSILGTIPFKSYLDEVVEVSITSSFMYSLTDDELELFQKFWRAFDRSNSEKLRRDVYGLKQRKVLDVYSL